jgi:hypothetical protein
VADANTPLVAAFTDRGGYIDVVVVALAGTHGWIGGVCMMRDCC